MSIVECRTNKKHMGWIPILYKDAYYGLKSVAFALLVSTSDEDWCYLQRLYRIPCMISTMPSTFHTHFFHTTFLTLIFISAYITIAFVISHKYIYDVIYVIFLRCRNHACNWSNMKVQSIICFMTSSDASHSAYVTCISMRYIWDEWFLVNDMPFTRMIVHLLNLIFSD